MSPFERDDPQRQGSAHEAPPDASAAPGSSSDAEDSAAHIAEMVRRTAERQARPDAPPAARLEATVEQPPIPPTPSARPAALRVNQPPRPAGRRPPTRMLVAGGAAAAVLIAGGFALSHPGNSQATPAPNTTAPALYTVQVTDVITDCVSHSHGSTKSSFKKENCVKATRFLATGTVSGRPTVFVLSQIRMASAEAAASLKQVLDATGTGNLNDLLREDKTYPGAPSTMPASGYASVQNGTVVVVAEAGFAHGTSASSNPVLRAAAARAAAQVTASS